MAHGKSRKKTLEYKLRYISKLSKLAFVISIAMVGLVHVNAVESILFYLPMAILVLTGLDKIREYNIDTMDVLVFIFVMISLLSSWLSPFGLKELWIAKLILEPVLVYFLVKIVFCEDDYNRTAFIFTVFLFILSIITFLNLMGLAETRFFRPVGSYKNTEGAYLVALMPFLYLISKSVLFSFVYSLFFISVIFLAKSKAAFFASLFIVFLWFTMINKKYMIVLLVAIALIAIFFHKNTLYYYNVVRSDPTCKRMYPWAISLRAAKSRPFLGWGVDKRIYSRVKMIFCKNDERRYLCIVHPHNDFLQVALMTGFLGLAVYLSILGFSVSNLIAGFRFGSGEVRIFSMSVLLSLVGAFIITGFFGIPAVKFRRFLWFLIGLSGSLRRCCDV